MDVSGASGNRWGLMTGDRYPLKAFMGPAVVVDVRDQQAGIGRAFALKPAGAPGVGG